MGTTVSALREMQRSGAGDECKKRLHFVLGELGNFVMKEVAIMLELEG